MLQLLKNATLFDPTPRGVAHLLIGGARILWTGSQVPDLDASLGVCVTDLEARTVIPGLIDAHAHITGGGGESGFGSRVPPPPIHTMTAAGVTTVVGLLGTDDTVRSTAELVARARGLCETGMTAYCHTGGYHVPPTTLTGSVRADLVHIDRIIGVGELAISDHRSSQPTLDELLRIAADAHVAGLMTGKAGIVHLHLGDGERGLELLREALRVSELPPRVFNPTHVNRRAALLDEAVALAKRGCTVDVTAFPESDQGDGIDAAAAVITYLERAGPSGGITVSSDGGGCLPEFDAQGRILRFDVGNPASLLATLRVLTARGLPLQEAIEPFTSNVAEILRLPRKGRLRAGADADLLVLDDTMRVWGTMARGGWHVKDGQAVTADRIEH